MRTNPTRPAPPTLLNVLLAAGFSIAILLLSYVLVRWPDNLFADDSYFYFQVAWNIARGMGSTFNNLISTNGYHPLWMLVCVSVFKIVPDKSAFVHAIGTVIAGLNIGTLLILVKVLRRWGSDVWFLAVFLYGAFAFLTQLGTEGALSGFFLSMVLLSAGTIMVAPNVRTMVWFNLFAALAVLSRLDSIFVVSLLALSMYLFSWKRVATDKLLLSSAIYPVLWGTYVTSNLVWFGTIQPISGMLKSHSHESHAIFANLPHVAIISLLLILVSVVVLALRNRDAFFIRVELPYVAGVLIHASYIGLVMSSETRWTWYYTSWWILAAVMASRAFASLTSHRANLRYATAGLFVVALLGIWWKESYQRVAHYVPDAKGIGYEENLVRRAGLHRVLAFDKPGRLAYYSDLQVVALDGLMGDLKFQKDLQTRGIREFVKVHAIDGFVGPSVPFGLPEKRSFCESVYLSSVQFNCTSKGTKRWGIDGVTVYARLTGRAVGTLPLRDDEIVWNRPGNIAAWRLN